MYADRSTLSHGPRPLSFGASLAISSAIIGALIFATPDMVTRITHRPTVVSTIPVPPDPEPVKPQPEPRTQLPRETQIVSPKPIVPILDPAPEIDTSDKIPAYVAPVLPGVPEGTGEKLVEAPPKPLPLVLAELDPRYARYLQPDYPTSEIRLAREGNVVVRVRIGVDGRVTAVEKVSATSDAFFDATRRQALAKWRFKPATRGGIPEESWKRMSVRFELNGG